MESLARLTPITVNLVFGKEWIEARKFVQLLAIRYFMKMKMNLISSTFYIVNALGKPCICVLILYLLICFSFWIAAHDLESSTA